MVLSLLLLILSSSRDDGSRGILVSWLLSRFSFFRKVKFYMTHSKKKGKKARKIRQNKWKGLLVVKSTISHPACQAGHSHRVHRNKPRKENVHLSHVYLSCCIFSKATLCGSSVKVAVVDMCPVKAVDCIFCSIPLAQPLVLCHYWDESKKKFSKNNFLLFSTLLAAAVF